MQFLTESSPCLSELKPRWVILPNCHSPEVSEPGLLQLTHQLSPEPTLLSCITQIRGKCPFNTNTCSESPVGTILTTQQPGPKMFKGILYTALLCPFLQPTESTLDDNTFRVTEQMGRKCDMIHHRQETFHAGSFSPHRFKSACAQPLNNMRKLSRCSSPIQDKTQAQGWESGVGATKAIWSPTGGRA